ncbi:MAG: helicase HerA-like domain-containing protein [Thioalkalivibrionaceae bacterium]
MLDLRIGSGGDGQAIELTPRRLNRHGLIAGATGTGKTVTLQVLVERFSDLGVPCFVPDIKGDFSGLAVAATPSDRLVSRAEALGVAPFEPRAFPVTFWEVAGSAGETPGGHPLRLTLADFGPQLLSRLLGLNDTQAGVIDVVFRVADDEGLLLLDLDDLRAMLAHALEHRQSIGPRYGNVAAASVGAIQRALLRIDPGAEDALFGEPAVTLDEFLQVDADGRGVVNVLHAERLYREQPAIYATVLLWLLSELFEQLPEVGDPERPVFALFLDEAHLLFRDTPKALVDRIEQVVRLIRSKGVGVYFITQAPTDIPEAVLGQLGLRVQHALRAFTPKDQRALRVAAETFRPNPEFSAAEVLPELAVGEALVSTLDATGAPTPVDRVRIRPPVSRIGPINAQERAILLSESPLAGIFDQRMNRESAAERLAQQAERALDPDHHPGLTQRGTDVSPTATSARSDRGGVRRSPQPRSVAGQIANQVAKQATRQITRQVTNQISRNIIRGLLGSLTGRR